jgi:hypothetical protein
MRILVKFSFPTEAGNDLIRSGRMEKLVPQMLGDLKPEAAYFFAENGQRTGFVVVNMQDSSEVAGIVEKFAFGIHAGVQMYPVMNAEDLHKGLAGMEDILKRYG